MTDIAAGDFGNALMASASLEEYCAQCARTMDLIHIGLLKALCRYRQGDRTWDDDLCAQLDTCAAYRFVWPVAQYGAAMLPLLTECAWGGDAAFLKTVVGATREQAVFYPRFLRIQPQETTPLSSAEKQVLRLICHDLSNQEIADILGISLATVKTHVSHILQKLGVGRRAEAKAMAERMGLV
jgi:LuxR family maltose regulon positive regulatory protein